VERVTALTSTIRSSVAVNRTLLAAGTFVVLGLGDIFLGLFAHRGDAAFQFSLFGASVQIPVLHVPAAPVAYAFGAASIVIGMIRAVADMGKIARRISLTTVLIFFVVALLCWAGAAATVPLNVVNLLQGTMTTSIPLILGALAGCMCERSGVINIAIEGQLLLGAFTAAIVASAVSVLWLGLVSGALAGGLLGALLAVFAIRYLVDQIVLGVVLNLLVVGLTGFLYDRILIPYANTLNSPPTFSALKIPVLGDIPIIGPVLFDSTIFLYITYLMIILVQVGLFSTRWGLRVRAVGEHPTAADTVGIRVLATRYRNVILGGLIAGIGGAFFTIGSVGGFGKEMTAGNGYIALAAMIFGRWTPLGAVGAALIFGFSESLQSVLSTMNVPIPSNILLMAPYIATIIAVAGLVGKVRAPKADGKPYIKA
jgi:general nucleoside transport system permease protein